MGRMEQSLEQFHKLHIMLPSSAEVICQLGEGYEILENYTESLEWYVQFDFIFESVDKDLY